MGTENHYFSLSFEITETVLTTPINYLVRKLNGFRTKSFILSFSANIYMFRFNNRKARKTCEICSKLTIKAPE